MTVDRQMATLAAVLLCLVLASGCATIGGGKQRMKISSQPEGAEVYYGEKHLGLTPGFIDVPRHQHAQIILRREGYPEITKDLNSSYRWGDSFSANFVWLFYGQPVASLVDLLTDDAWDYDKIGTVTLGTTLSPEKSKPPRIIAIAPPQIEYELVSDELGLKLQKDAYKYFPASEIEPFEKTQPVFSNFSYDYRQKTDEYNRDNLYDKLKATHVLESKAEKDEHGDVTVTTSLVDIFSDKEVKTFKERIPARELVNKPEFDAKNFGASLLNLMPNLITFDFDTPSSDLQIRSGAALDQYQGITNKTATVLNTISAFGIRSVRAPKYVSGVKGVFRFVPFFTFSYDQFYFAKAAPNPLEGFTFDWLTMAGGVGPEGGFDTNIGYFYLNVVPCYSINWIEGYGNGLDASSRTTSLTLELEVGYSIFASQRINLRLFDRAIGIPNNAFSNLLPQLTGQPAEVDSATRNVIGLSVGYYFPEDRAFVKKALF